MSNVLSQFEKGEIQDGYRKLIRGFGSYVELSRDMACEQSESYRDFEVGSVGVAMRPGSSDLVTVVGANLKIKHLEDENTEDERELEIERLFDTHLIPRNPDPVCAEMSAVIQSEDKGLFFVAHIVAATTDIEEIAGVTRGLRLPTLPPCGNCVPVLDKSPSTSRATLYVSAGLDENIFQVRNMRMLKNLYLRREESGVAVGRISVQNTALSLAYYNDRIAAHDFSNGLPARAVSSFTRQALTYPSTARQ
jgi:hypothetical protein